MGHIAVCAGCQGHLGSPGRSRPHGHSASPRGQRVLGSEHKAETVSFGAQPGQDTGGARTGKGRVGRH